jgi:hypothetical protein
MRRTLALDKLQEFLLAMAPGDEVSAKRASEISGLDYKNCAAILDALMRAGIMMRLQHDAYVRCRLRQTEQRFDPTAEPPVTDGKAPVLLHRNA